MDAGPVAGGPLSVNSLPVSYHGSESCANVVSWNHISKDPLPLGLWARVGQRRNFPKVVIVEHGDERRVPAGPRVPSFCVPSLCVQIFFPNVDPVDQQEPQAHQWTFVPPHRGRGSFLCASTLGAGYTELLTATWVVFSLLPLSSRSLLPQSLTQPARSPIKNPFLHSSKWFCFPD